MNINIKMDHDNRRESWSFTDSDGNELDLKVLDVNIIGSVDEPCKCNLTVLVDKLSVEGMNIEVTEKPLDE